MDQADKASAQGTTELSGSRYAEYLLSANHAIPSLQHRPLPGVSACWGMSST